MHGSEVMLCIKMRNGCTYARTHERPFQRAITQKRGIILIRKKNMCQLFCFEESIHIFQNPSMHVSEVMLCIEKRNECTDGRTDARTHERPLNMPLQP